MRQIMIVDTPIRVSAGPLTLLHYRQEFNEDLAASIMKMKDLSADPTQIDCVALLRLIWAMAKTAAGFGVEFPSFIEWVASLEAIDMSDAAMFKEVIEEAVGGLFRRGNRGPQQ